MNVVYPDCVEEPLYKMTTGDYNKVMIYEDELRRLQSGNLSRPCEYDVDEAITFIKFRIEEIRNYGS